jgi:hypothetical protein
MTRQHPDLEPLSVWMIRKVWAWMRRTWRLLTEAPLALRH